MCNIWKNPQTEDPSIDKISKFFDDNRSFLSELKFIQLTGGEPFLRDDLPELAKIVHSVAPQCVIWFPTNGLLPEKIHDTVYDILLTDESTKIGVTVSLDGEGKMHDIHRGIDGAYKKALETLTQLSHLKEDYGLLLSTGFTMTQINYKHASYIQKIAYNHGADFSFRPINISEHYYKNMDEKGDFTEDVLPFLDGIAYNIKKEKGTLNNLTKLAYIQGAKEFINGSRTLPCSAARESVFIDAFGDVYPCIVMNHKLGNVYQNTLSDILDSPSTHEARAIIEKLECPTCWLECEVYRDIKKDWGRLIKAIL